MMFYFIDVDVEKEPGQKQIFFEPILISIETRIQPQSNPELNLNQPRVKQLSPIFKPKQWPTMLHLWWIIANLTHPR